MKHIAKLSRAVILLLALVLCTSAAFAQDAVVKRNVYLRPAPSTSNQPIRKLIPPDEVELIEPNPVDGYYHVRTVEGDEEGWVWAKNIRIGLVTEADAEAEVGVATFAASATAASNISPAWTKPTPVTGTFKSGTKTCGPTGSRGRKRKQSFKKQGGCPLVLSQSLI